MKSARMVSTRFGVHVTPATLAEAIAEGRRLTDRDRSVIDLLADHRVLTAEQVARVGFPNDTRARHRLLLLAQRGVLARFRACVYPGSQPWRYTLGIIGEALHAAATGKPIPRSDEIHRKIVRLSQSRTLDHLLGVNEFFTSLLSHAHSNEGCELVEWWPETRTAEACGKIVWPDGYGKWIEDDREVDFFLEYDNATERGDILPKKMDKYGELADAGVVRPVLFVFSSAHRENNFHRNAHRLRIPPTVPVATAATDGLTPAGVSPAERVWLPVGGGGRLRLAELATHPTSRATLARWGDERPAAA